MRKPSLLFAFSLVFTVLVVAVCLVPATGVSAVRWGLFDAELSGEIVNQVVVFPGAHGGYAVQLGGGEPLTGFTFAAYGAPREALARVITIRIKNRPCDTGGGSGGSNRTRVSLSIDGVKIDTFALDSQKWRNYSATIPDGFDVTSTVKHNWTVRLENPVTAAGCRRAAYIDIGGWESVGKLTAADFARTVNPAGAALLADPLDDENSYMHLTGASTIAGTPDISWGDSLYFIVRGSHRCGMVSRVEVSVAGVVLRELAVANGADSDNFKRHAIGIPKWLRSDTPQRLSIRFVNPGRGGKDGCQRFVDVRWVYGSFSTKVQ